MDAGNSTEALLNFRKATQHSISDARFWYHRFATETALGEKAAAAFSLKVASTARAMNPGREKQTMAGISSIQGNLRLQIVRNYLTTRLALSTGTTADELITAALKPKDNPTTALESRLVTLHQSDDTAEASPALQDISKWQAVAKRMLLEEEPIAGVTQDDLASFRKASQLAADGNEDVWANRVAAGLDLGTDEITWRLDICAENTPDFQSLVLDKIIGEILQKKESQETYERLIKNIKIEPNSVDCSEKETGSDEIPEDEVTPACCCPCPDPCARPARRCFLRR